MRDCAQLLAPSRSMLILTAYAIRASALAIDQVARDALEDRRGQFTSGELAIRGENGGRVISTSLYTRWCADDLGL